MCLCGELKPGLRLCAGTYRNIISQGFATDTSSLSYFVISWGDTLAVESALYQLHRKCLQEVLLALTRGITPHSFMPPHPPQ